MHFFWVHILQIPRPFSPTVYCLQHWPIHINTSCNARERMPWYEAFQTSLQTITLYSSEKQWHSVVASCSEKKTMRRPWTSKPAWDTNSSAKMKLGWLLSCCWKKRGGSIMQVVSRRGDMVFLPSGGHERPMAAILPLSSHNGQGIWRWKFIAPNNYTTLLLAVRM